MNPEERQALRDVINTPGYRVLVKIMKEKMDELKDVTKIDQSQDVAAQAVGKSYAYSALQEFLSTVDLLSQAPTEKKNTYE